MPAASGSRQIGKNIQFEGTDMIMTVPRIAHIYRYPVKGLNGERLVETQLTAGKGIPFDRIYAIAHGDTEFDPHNPQYLGKRHFLMLMKENRLAELDAAFDAGKKMLTLRKDGQQCLVTRLDHAEDVAAFNAFFEAFMAGQTRGGVKLVTAPGHMFADIPDQNLSFINLESVKDFESKTGLVIDHRRFRGNIYLKDLEAWREFDLLGKRFQIGEAVFQGAKKIERCAATNVNPDTADKDMNIPLQLRKTYGHFDMGIYVDVIQGGQIRQSDRLVIL